MAKVLVKNTTEHAQFLSGPTGDNIQVQPWSQTWVDETYTTGVIPTGLIITRDPVKPKIQPNAVTAPLPRNEQPEIISRRTKNPSRG